MKHTTRMWLDLCFLFVSFFGAERGGVYEATVVRHRLPGEELAGLDLVWGSESVNDLFGGTLVAVTGGVFSLEDEIVNGPGHDSAERAQSRWRILSEWWHQFAIIQRNG